MPRKGETIYGEPLRIDVRFRLTRTQQRHLSGVAARLGTSVNGVVRDAVDEFLDTLSESRTFTTSTT